MRRTPVFIFRSSVSIILIVWSVGFVVDLLDDAKRLVEVRLCNLVSFDQIEPRSSDLDKFIIIDVEAESVDIVTLPRGQEADFFDGVLFLADSGFQRIEDSFFNRFCHVRLGIFRGSSVICFRHEVQSR